ncbi:MAG: cysteine-rich CWC family protein [Thermodesulfobacteriota bacterium]|nr:cysteine-rich CWC family protein [Thermodesulfobacteriota bacterium]
MDNTGNRNAPDIEEKLCPICGQPNRCGEKAVVNGITLEKCWCAYEKFPKEALNRVPGEKRGKACICINCLNRFKQALR